MSRSFLSNLRSDFNGRKPVRHSTNPAKRLTKFRPSLGRLDDRLVPSSVPLHVVGNQIKDPANNTVVLRGVNIPGLESYPTGILGDPAQVLQSVDVALNTWHANLLRLTVYPDFWFGHDQGVGLGEQADGGAAYRSLVNQVVVRADNANAYVMLTVWGSDRGQIGAAPALHNLPDSGTTQFWADATFGAARLYANNAAVLFDPFNEPHDVSWSQWRNGGVINDNGVTYNSPGMQGLLQSIRSTGANNIVAPEGLGYGSDLSGINQGFALTDSAKSLMYQLHLYPAEWQTPADGDAKLVPLAGQYPVYIGEFGTPRDAADPASEVNGVPQPNASAWTQNMLNWVTFHQYSWSAWSFGPQTPPCLVSDYNYTPTTYFGTFVKNALATNPSPAPANDNFANRATITGLTATVTGTNVDATREIGEPLIYGNGGGHSVWYTWTASASGSVTIATTGSNYDTLLGVYTGTSVSALGLVMDNDDANGGQQSSVTFNATGGTAYQIAVDGHDGSVGNITMMLALTPSVPANDNFANRATITGSNATVTGTNVAATREMGEPLIYGNGGGSSVWYTWTASATGSVTINLAGSNFDTLLGVYTGTSVSALALKVDNDDANGGQQSSVTFDASAGTAYQIAVDGYDGSVGNITMMLALTPSGPANDDFANRTTINGSTSTITGTNVNATREAGEPLIYGNGGGHSVWYTWTASATGSVTIATTGSNFDTLLGVYTGTSVSALGLVMDNDDANGGQQSSVTFTAKAGTAYQIAVDGYDGSVGNITMKVEASSQSSTAKVTAVQVNNGSAQRSRVTGLVVTFANLSALPATPADAFQLKRQSDNAAVALAASVAGNVVTLTFTGGPVQSDSLADGRYTLSVLATKVNGGNFDGNGDGTAGDDYSLIGSPVNGLFRLFGDSNGDGTVNGTDFLAFRLAFLGSGSTFDFNGDGQVTGTDFLQFRLRFLQSV